MKIKSKPRVPDGRLPQAGEIWRAFNKDWRGLVFLIVETGNYAKHPSRIVAVNLSRITDKYNKKINGINSTWNGRNKFDAKDFVRSFEFVCKMENATLILPK